MNQWNAGPSELPGDLPDDHPEITGMGKPACCDYRITGLLSSDACQECEADREQFMDDYAAAFERALAKVMKSAEGWICRCGAAADPLSGSWRTVDGRWQHHHEALQGHIDAIPPSKEMGKAAGQLGATGPSTEPAADPSKLLQFILDDLCSDLEGRGVVGYEQAIRAYGDARVREGK